MKKLIAFLLAVVMVMSFAACGGDKPAETTAPKTPETTVPVTTVPETTGAPQFDWTGYADWLTTDWDSKTVSYQFTGEWALPEYGMNFSFLINLYEDGSVAVDQRNVSSGSSYMQFGYWSQKQTEDGNEISLDTLYCTGLQEGELIAHEYHYDLYEEADGGYSFGYTFGIAPGAYFRTADVVGSSTVIHATTADFRNAVDVTQSATIPVEDQIAEDVTQSATIPVEDRIVVSCLGDSITFGAGVKGKENTYPGKLQELLGGEYMVKNHGGNGRTLLREGLSAAPGNKYSVNITIWDSQHMKDSVEANPDIVVIALGTNDAKTFNWNAESFREQYVELVKYYQGLENKPEVYVVMPPAVFEGFPEIQALVIADEVGPIVKEVAQECGCEVIDLYSITKDQGALFPDGVHPNAEGNALIAKAIFDAITK